MSHLYIEVNGVPVPEADTLSWGRWMEHARQEGTHHVGHDVVGDVRISTVFLGVNHSFFGEELPILYETMIFGGPLDGEQERYPLRVLAAEGHARWVERVKKAALATN